MSQAKHYTEVQSSELNASAGTFTKQALAWIKIPFTALLLVTAASLMAVSVLLHVLLQRTNVCYDRSGECCWE